jgi:hypothetical protein
MIEVEGPDGTVIEFPEGTAPDVIKGVMQKRYGAPQAQQPEAAPAPAQSAAPAQERSMMDWLLGRNLSPEQQAQTDAWQQSLSAKPTGPSGAENMVQGMTFNYGDDVARMVGATGMADQLNNQQEAFRKAHPVGSMVYEGLGSAIGAAGAGKVLSATMPSVAAAMNPVGRSIGQRALRYGAAGGLGSGVAASGEQDASIGSVAASTALGAGLGAATPYVGQMAQKAFNRVTGSGPKPAVPQIKGNLEEMMQQTGELADDFKAQATQKYQQIRDAGAVISPKASERLRQNMLLVGGRANENLAPSTAGMKQRVMEVLRQREAVDFESVHELSMEINQELREKLKPNDARLLGRMKDQLDNFISGAKADDLLAGTSEAVKMLREADSLYAQRMKSELIKTVIDNADRKTGRYTQSGVANTIRQQAEALYTQIQKGKAKGFSKEEIALIRQMAKSTDVNAAVRWMAKFAPRGVVSTMLGFGPSAFAGPAAWAIPAAGEIAGRAADRAAIGSLGRLASSAAYGPAALAKPLPPQLSAPLERMLLPAGVGASTAIGQRVQ